MAILQLIELPVEAAMRQELLMVAALAKLSLVHDEDGVRALDRREPMGDQNGGTPRDHAREGEAHAKFGLGVDRGRGFFKDEDSGIVSEGAGKADQLLLAVGYL